MTILKKSLTLHLSKEKNKVLTFDGLDFIIYSPAASLKIL